MFLDNYEPMNSNFVDIVPVDLFQLLVLIISRQESVDISICMTYHQVCKKSNMTSGAGTTTLPEHLSSPTPYDGVLVARSLVFCLVVCKLLFVLFSIFSWTLYCMSFY
jgi:hypothetical protein